MTGKANIGLILLLLLAMFFVTMATASASTKTYSITSTTGSINPLAVTSGNTAEIYYSPSAVGTRTFKISNNQIALTKVGTVAFYWTDNGTWNLWKTANLGLLSVSEKLYSGSSNIRFKIVVKPVSGAYINAKVTIT